MPEFRLGEEQVEILNPLPGTIDKDVTRQARVYRPSDSGTPEFSVRYRWGNPAQKVILFPGSKLTVPISMGQEIMATHGEVGLVMLKPGDDVIQKKMEGLTRAAEYYRVRGAVSLMQLQAGHNWSDAQYEALRQEFAGQHVNVVREELIRAELRRVQESPIPVPVEPTLPERTAEKTEKAEDDVWDYNPGRRKPKG